jgi:hypothetical protein
MCPPRRPPAARGEGGDGEMSELWGIWILPGAGAPGQWLHPDNEYDLPFAFADKDYASRFLGRHFLGLYEVRRLPAELRGRVAERGRQPLPLRRRAGGG